MSRRDPSGYYAALGLDPEASSEQIKRPFKSKARQFHPDTNPAPDANQRVQLVNEAYQVLGDPHARASYDAGSYGSPEDAPAARGPAIEPVVCSVCHRLSAQPRYVIHRHVISALLITWRVARQGIYCSECAAKNAYRASLKTWLAGWWGIPWGPIYSIHAIYSNMLGGEQPPLNNFKILSCQAMYFAHLQRIDLARAIARDALVFGYKTPEHDRLDGSQIARLIGALTRVVTRDGSSDSAPALKNSWGFGSRAFKVQLAGAAVVSGLIIGIVALGGNLSQRVAYKHVPPREAAIPKPQATPADFLNEATSKPVFDEPLLPLPATGKIREFWRKDGATVLAPLKVITAAGSPNYYVKMLDWHTHEAVLVFFIRSGEKVTMRVPLGIYELRYAAGEKWYGEEYLFGPGTSYARASDSFAFRSEGGTVHGFSVELIKQLNGNLREVAIRASDF